MKKGILAALALSGCLLAAPSAFAANVDIGVSIGIPGFITGPAWYPPPPRYQRPIIVTPRPVYVKRFEPRHPGWKGHHPKGHRNHWKGHRGHRR